MQSIARIPDLPNNSFFAMNRWFYKMYQAGLLFHPDDAAKEIVDQSGNATFTGEECEQLDEAVGRMFKVHGDLVYDVGLTYFQKALGITPRD